MKTNRLCVAPALVGAVVSVFALTAGSALGHPVRNTIRECTEIRNPGFYLLTRNLTAAVNDDCLVVRTSFVTIDLGGWVISGRSNDPDQLGVGITITGESVQNTTVRNGTITGFGDAINLGRRAVVENVRAFGNQGGIVAASDSTVSGSNVEGFELGVTVGPRSIVSGNRVFAALAAITTGSGSIVSGNVVTVDIDHGIQAGVGSTVSGNTVQGLEADVGVGISVECPSNVIGNTATQFAENLTLSGDGCTNIDNLAP
jgi:hypothetical protein